MLHRYRVERKSGRARGRLLGRGGGGSGGNITLQAERITLLGDLDVTGGDGGDSFDPAIGAGGGGAGGRIAIHSGSGPLPTTFMRITEGSGGTGPGAYGDGGDGRPGTIDQVAFAAYFTDCNSNGIEDTCDILDGTSSDLDANAIPDECDGGPDYCFGLGIGAPGCTGCPCGNEQLSTNGGCLNAAGTSARLTYSGVPSVSADTLRFELVDANPSTFALLISGAALAPANPTHPCFGWDTGVQSLFTNGLRCAVQDFRRHGTRATDSLGRVGVTTPGWGRPDNPVGGLSAHGGFVAGQRRHFQVFYRDTPFNAPFGFCSEDQNTTQAVTVNFIP